MALITRWIDSPQLVATTGFATILATTGIAAYFDYSPLLACLFLGLTQANVFRDRDKVVDALFHNFEPAILAVFFTLGGMELSLDHLAKAGLAAGAFFVLRALGKYVAALVAMRVANAPETLQKNLGLALVLRRGSRLGWLSL